MRFLFRVLFALVIVTPCRAATVTVSVGGGGNSFSPAMFTINPGDTVKWVWAAGFHNTSSVTFPAGALDWYSNITGTDTAFRYVPSVSGLYTYTCTYHSGMNGQFFVTGCTYPDKPVVSSANGTVACEGDTLHLSVPLQTGAGYQWIEGVTTIPQAITNTLKVTHSGSYKILVNRCGADSVSSPFAITINARPEAAYTYSYEGLSYHFINNSAIGPYIFLWTFDDGSPDGTTKNTDHTFPAAGNYTVTLKVTDTLTGCSDTFSSVLAASTVGISDPEENLFSISPNPASDHIRITGRYDAFIYVQDLNGRTLKAQAIKQGGQNYIDVRMLRGTFLLKVISSRGTEVRKMLIAP